MSRHKTSAIADLATRADAGRQLVVSVGSLDGPFLAALAKVKMPTFTNISGAPSAWSEGIATAKSISHIAQEGADSDKDTPD